MRKGFTEKDVTEQNGKTIVITGSNTGLGYEAARVLSARGARVIIACRSQEKAADAMARIEKANGKVDVAHIPLDLGNLASIKSCAKQLNKEKKIDILINNAGIMIPPYELTQDGFESQFGVNHLGPFALTALLLEKLSAAPNPRVVNTSSIAHRSGKIRFDDINADRGYNPVARYAMSKVANLLFTYELQRRLDSAAIPTLSVACHPGIADTELSRYVPGYLRLVVPIVRPFFNTSASGAWPTLLATTSDTAKSGDYFGPAKRRETAGPAVKVRSNQYSHNQEVAARLWDVSVEMTGIDPGI